MQDGKSLFKSVVATIKSLVAMDPSDPKVHDVVNTLASASDNLSKLASDTDADFTKICDQVEKLHNAAVIPATNYRRIATITNKLRGLVKVASLPQNVSVRPQIVDIVRKTAGVFSEVDTVEDLNKPLETIEKAIEKLYKNPNSPATYKFDNSYTGPEKK